LKNLRDLGLSLVLVKVSDEPDIEEYYEHISGNMDQDTGDEL